ncbi:MAG: cytochrome c biogenesis protein ResB [Deltaproteobacteria bacterium]|uniref:Cytochrome c biogenesis protein ResB n=1 Tax=Candidatus Zymogenus saltonus TaxID=2844893 RepID=A0A9D8PNA4_9DELT|nr:cytochrome c biogenesis protein ResB [Candidatus Zymogenus saltonus]
MSQNNGKNEKTIKRPSEKSVVVEVIEYLSSIRFTVVILTTIAIVAGIGTLVGQNLPETAYIDLYGDRLYSILKLFSITDIYHSVYFNALLALFITNLTLCTLKFAPARIRDALSRDIRRRSYSHSEKIESGVPSEECVLRVKKALGRHALRPFHRVVKKRAGKKIELFSEPHPILSLGALVVHISIIVIILGGLVSSLFGFSGEMIISEGSSSNELFVRSGHIYKLDFDVALEKFTIESYSDGTPKEYRSDIRFKRGGSEVDAALTVNHPAKFDGIRFYQSDFGNSLEEAVISIYDKDGKRLFEGKAPYMVPVPIEDLGIAVILAEFFDNYENRGPAAHIIVVKGEKMTALWANTDPPELAGPAGRGKDGLLFVLKSYKLIPYSGISASYEPGLPLVWTGFILLSIGFTFPLLSMSGRFKVVIDERTGKGEKALSIEVCGSPGRIKGDFPGRFDKLVKTIEENLC